MISSILKDQYVSPHPSPATSMSVIGSMIMNEQQVSPTDVQLINDLINSLIDQLDLNQVNNKMEIYLLM